LGGCLSIVLASSTANSRAIEWKPWAWRPSAIICIYLRIVYAKFSLFVISWIKYCCCFTMFTSNSSSIMERKFLNISPWDSLEDVDKFKSRTALSFKKLSNLNIIFKRKLVINNYHFFDVIKINMVLVSFVFRFNLRIQMAIFTLSSPRESSWPDFSGIIIKWTCKNWIITNT